MIELKRLTNKLKNELWNLQQKYETTERHQNQRDRDFFEHVRHDSAPLFELIDEWYDQTKNVINEYKLAVYEEQVEATKENFEMLILHSYYADIRMRRYVEMNRSCLYVFDQLLKEIMTR